jgi:hypothetical protein
LGRDQFVKVVLKGFMFPLGHRAVKITITERKLAMGTNINLEGKPIAYLRQITFIVIKEPIKNFSHRRFSVSISRVQGIAVSESGEPNASRHHPAHIRRRHHFLAAIIRGRCYQRRAVPTRRHRLGWQNE